MNGEDGSQHTVKYGFDSSVSIPERMKTLNAYARGLLDSKHFTILETKHFSDGSQMKALFSNDK